MFTVYHSNQLDLLKTIAATLMRSKPLYDLFQPEIILVESKGMAEWMQIELATELSIAANIEFLPLDNFIRQMFTYILPDIVYEGSFSKLAMTWRLMMLLPRLCKEPHFFIINEYLRIDKDSRKLFQFSAKMADLFDQYFIYRPNWLESWQNGKLIDGLGKTQLWQASLWRELVLDTKGMQKTLWYHTNIYKYFIQTLQESKIKPSKLPDRIFICGISAIPPNYLYILQALGNHIDIHLLLINPCCYYWGDIQDCVVLKRSLDCNCPSDKHQVSQTIFRYPEIANSLFNELNAQEIVNPLLASWGKLGRDNLYMLTQLENITEINAFIKPAGNNLLSLVQRDILMLENHAVVNIDFKIAKKAINKRVLKLDDRSLSFHVCHSLQREVEVLHDFLLGIMTEDPTLQPRDIIVMVADIEQYIPAIQAVFSNDDDKRDLPFIISDRHIQHLHPVITAFLSLLELPRSRFSVDQVMKLLEVPALAARFSIDEQELHQLYQWIIESGIRWGLDDSTLNELMLPANTQHTWQFGLKRMLLGYVMDSDSGDWQGILPFDKSRELLTNLVGQLAELLMHLRKWRNRLAQLHSPDVWLSYAREIIQDFFIPDSKAEIAVAFLEKHWKQILESALQAGYDQLVPITILQDELSIRLKQELMSQGFLAGSINFCTLTPMRSLPFRVVCLLGMNDGIYPRTLQNVGFDLMAEQPQLGDRSRRYDDRYLFLETILSAQQTLYISFIGRAIQDNTLHYPSVLVSELSDYIIQSFYLPDHKQTDTESNNDRVYKYLWHWHSRMPFAPENFLPGSKNQSFAYEWLPAASGKGKPQLDFFVPLSILPCKILTLNELLCFYRHPVRAWFLKRLLVDMYPTSFKISTSEPFIIDNLTRYQLNEQLLRLLINGESTEKFFRQVRGAGLLPYGSFGTLYWIKQCQDMAILAENIRMWRLPHTYNLEVNLVLENITLSGWLPQIQNNGLQLRWRPGTLSIKDGLLLWIEHLSYCAMGGKGESRMFGIYGEWHFASLPADQAKMFLYLLVSGYIKGMSSILLLLPHSGGAWLSHCYNQTTKTLDRSEIQQRYAYKKLLRAWQGDNYVTGDCKDPYLQRLIYRLEERHIKTIISTAEQYLLPLFIFNLVKT